MTWPAAIAAALGVIAVYLITRHQHHEHRSTTEQHTEPTDGERP